MDNRLRYRTGQTHLRKFAVDSATVIDAGDMVWLDADDVKPAPAFVWTTNLATTQAAFAAKFAGIAHEASAAGETAEISVDVSPDSVYEMLAASATYEVGDPVGPDESPATTLADQTVEGAVSTSAIGRVVERADTAVTKVLCTFASAYHTGSSNVNADVG